MVQQSNMTGSTLKMDLEDRFCRERKTLNWNEGTLTFVQDINFEEVLHSASSGAKNEYLQVWNKTSLSLITVRNGGRQKKHTDPLNTVQVAYRSWLSCVWEVHTACWNFAMKHSCSARSVTWSLASGYCLALPALHAGVQWQSCLHRLLPLEEGWNRLRRGIPAQAH